MNHYDVRETEEEKETAKNIFLSFFLLAALLEG